MSRLACLVVAVIVAGMALSTPAAAGDPAKVTAARKLAIQAADHLDAKRYQAAIDSATQAEELYHAPTHVLIVAEGLEGLGKLAEALDTYEKLAAEPLPVTAPKPFRVAREQAEKQQRGLLARVPSLLVRASGPPDSAITMTVDGKPVALGASSALRRNPGKHTIELDAPGWQHALRDVELPDKGGVVTVEIALARVGAPAAGALKPESKGLKVASFVLMGVGGAGLVAGGVTGALSLHRVSELRGLCPQNHCGAAQQSLIDGGKTLGTASTIGFAAGGAVAATGIILAIVASVGKPAAEKAQASVSPWATPGAAGLEGRF